MIIEGYVSRGYHGELVRVEVDLRRGIPGMEIVGLPDGAVREARERVRAALRNSGFSVPRERILINLAPADVKKEGTAFDLPIAAAVLAASGQLLGPPETHILVVGELELSGRVRAVRGVLAAAAAAMQGECRFCIVPGGNLGEARIAAGSRAAGLDRLSRLPLLTRALLHGESLSSGTPVGIEERPENGHLRGREEEEGKCTSSGPGALDFADLRGQGQLKRACEIAAAGGHHLLLFGPPGGGKSMAAARFGTILPDLRDEEALETTRVHSIGGMNIGRHGLLRRPPVRMPHHTASREGLIGGGRRVLPGEISLAHRGVLVLDETLEFPPSRLQALREPIERGGVEIARSGLHYWYPSRFQLLLITNPCPCGKLGLPEAICMCSPAEIHRHWKKLGAAMLDRIDMRVAVQAADGSGIGGEIYSDEASGDAGGREKRAQGTVREGSAEMRRRVETAVEVSRRRLAPLGRSRNAELDPATVERMLEEAPEAAAALEETAAYLGLSGRGRHSLCRIARTIADLAGSETLERHHILEAAEYRRYGDGDYCWSQ